jgi:anti-sigma regulatory factor (Ser/Thr protein kinase)
MTDSMNIEISNELSELERLHQTLADFCRRHGLAAQVARDLNLAVEEIVTNIITHGYADDREHRISVHLSLEQGEVKIDVEDDGRPFNPLEAPAVDTTTPLADRPIGGLGIHLVRKVTDGLEYKRLGDKNIFTLKKNIHES